MKTDSEINREIAQKKLHKTVFTIKKQLENPLENIPGLEDAPEFEEEEVKVINARLDDLLFEKVNNQVRILKILNGKAYSKERWLLDAIERKLSKEVDIKNTPTTRFRVISFKADTDFLEKIDHQVALLRKLRGTYSRNQWILDAINEKISAEEEFIEKVVKKFSKNEKPSKKRPTP